MHITSRDNSLLRDARAVRDGKVDELIYVEGLRLAEEALRSGLIVEAVIYSEQIARKEVAAKFIEAVSAVARRTASVSEKLLESISYTKTPQGIVVLAQRPESSVRRLTEAISPSSLLVILHQINNPVNVGAILRTAEAAGVAGVVTTQRTTDPFSPKSLRGAMGSAFRLPIWRDAEYSEVVGWCHRRNITTICTDASGETPYTAVDWRVSAALILGPESTGLHERELASAQKVVAIPMNGEVESLNVSVAAGIVLFEAARQRGWAGR
jgi:TrmH family RNA methyltransferase